MSNWAENPAHQRSAIAKHALPFLKHAECRKNCVNDFEKGELSEGESTCLNNC